MTSALLFCLLALHPCRLSGAADIELRHEPGVETRLLLSALARYQVMPQITLSGQVAVAGLDNSGIAGYGLGSRLQPLRSVPVALELRLAHQQWRDWQTGENRISGLLAAEPMPALQLGAGAAWRVPMTGHGRWNSPLHWHSDMPEWNLAYEARWYFLRLDDWHAAAFATNLDQCGMHAPQQFPFGLEAARQIRSRLLMQARVTASIKGFSGPLGSLGMVSASVGVTGGL